MNIAGFFLKTIGVLLLFLIVCYVLLFFFYEKPLPTDRLIDVTLSGYGEDTHFRIPEYYFRVLPPQNGRTGNFELRVRLPDFVPDSIVTFEETGGDLPIREPSSRDYNHKAGFDRLWITVKNSNQYMIKKRQESSVLSDSLKGKIPLPLIHNLYYLGQKPIDHLGRSGRTYRQKPDGSILKIGNRVFDFYVPKKGFSKEGFYIGCRIYKTNPPHYCTIFFDIGPDIAVETWFSYRRLKDWPNLREQITDFITSFIIHNQPIDQQGN